MRTIRQPKDRIFVNYKKRYKWLYTKSFPSNEEVTIIPIPDVDQFLVDSEQTIVVCILCCVSELQDTHFITLRTRFMRLKN